MKKNEFTVGLAAADALPVLFFSGTIAALSKKLKNKLFLLGAILCILAGTGKVIWKFIMAVKKVNIPILSRQMRFLMPAGFAGMIAGVCRSDPAVRRSIGKNALNMPSVLFYGLGAAGIAGMVVCAKKMDQKDAKANMIEQSINAAAQGSFLAGTMLL